MATFCVRCGHQKKRFGSDFDSAKQMHHSCVDALFEEIQCGTLPIVPTCFVLPPGEICHAECSAENTLNGHGCLLAITNRRILCDTGDTIEEVDLGSVLKVEWAAGELNLMTSKKILNGWYALDMPDVVAEIILAAVRGFHASTLPQPQPPLLRTGPDRDGRYIAKETRAAVWARDGARCVQCGSESYLEFDHIIPLSKGGATSTNNLQLLCRGCNADKSDKI